MSHTSHRSHTKPEEETTTNQPNEDSIKNNDDIYKGKSTDNKIEEVDKFLSTNHMDKVGTQEEEEL